MTEPVGKAAGWCQTTVAIREDLLAAARSAGLDIQDLCNRALADAAGIRYKPEPNKREESPEPVIIIETSLPQADAKKPESAAGTSVHPVINADDPKARAAVKGLHREKPVPKPAALPGRVSPPERPRKSDLPAQAVPAPSPITEKPKRISGGKAPKRSGKSPIRQFVTEHIVRDDGEDCHVSKEALYAALTQWCRERRIAAPDRRAVTVALKNQFAMTEATVNGEPSWTNARLR